jgi:hypothetical protein
VYAIGYTTGVSVVRAFAGMIADEPVFARLDRELERKLDELDEEWWLSLMVGRRAGREVEMAVCWGSPAVYGGSATPLRALDAARLESGRRELDIAALTMFAVDEGWILLTTPNKPGLLARITLRFDTEGTTVRTTALQVESWGADVEPFVDGLTDGLGEQPDSFTLELGSLERPLRPDLHALGTVAGDLIVEVLERAEHKRRMLETIMWREPGEYALRRVDERTFSQLDPKWDWNTPPLNALRLWQDPKGFGIGLQVNSGWSDSQHWAFLLDVGIERGTCGVQITNWAIDAAPHTTPRMREMFEAGLRERLGARYPTAGTSASIA